MRRYYFTGPCFLIIFFLFFSFVSCSATKNIVKKITPAKDNLKKRVMVLPIINQAGAGSITASQITEIFVEFLKKSPHLLLYESPKGLSWPPTNKLNQFGVVFADDDLVKKAEDLGINAIITGILNPIEKTNKKTGIWPFRKSHTVYEVCVVINVMDISSKTLLLSKLESEEALADEEKITTYEEEVLTDKKEISDQMLRKSLTPILGHLASSVASKLLKAPWNGKILATRNTSVDINAGKDVGLKPGQRFDVFGLGESIAAKNGRILFLLGEKIGEIKVTSVGGKNSLAVPEAKEPLLPGQVIRFIGD
ncbi:MAG TPA: hypothetical protein DDW42_02810 [Desulfobacteraceae bacterium]|nr:hypothetical protein [Desulfobacteraceae bacterium]